MLLLVIFLGPALSITGGRCADSEVLVEAGAEAVLPCMTSLNPITVQWTKISGSTESTVWRIEQSGLEFRGYGVGQRSDCPHSSFRRGDFSLHIDRVQKEDGGEYICTVGKENQQTRKVVVLRVIQVSFTPARPVEGSRVTVSCSVTPSPVQVSVSWTLNGSPLPGFQRYMKQQQIKSVSPREVGNWTCALRMGRKEGTATQALSMRGFVHPASPLTQVYAEVGSTVILPCMATEGLTYTGWEREQDEAGPPKPLPPSIQQTPFSSHAARDLSLRVASVEERDGGTYRCFGMLEERRVERELQLVTAQVQSTASGKPNTPVTLTCHLSNESRVTSFEWVRVTYDINGTQRVTSLDKTKTLKIQNTEENSGEWACRFYGKEGILGNATYHLQVLSHLLGQKASGSSGKVATVTGLTFLFLVMALIALQMYKNHRRRKMILQYPALETIVHSSSNAREERARNKRKQKEQSQQAEV